MTWLLEPANMLFIEYVIRFQKQTNECSVIILQGTTFPPTTHFKYPLFKIDPALPTVLCLVVCIGDLRTEDINNSWGRGRQGCSAIQNQFSSFQVTIEVRLICGSLYFLPDVITYACFVFRL
jgi:hypothetical protein